MNQGDIDMLLSLLLLILFIFIGRYILVSVKMGKLESYYGENSSPVFREEPIGFCFILLLYVGLWVGFGYLLYTRWPWL